MSKRGPQRFGEIPNSSWDLIDARAAVQLVVLDPEDTYASFHKLRHIKFRIIIYNHLGGADKVAGIKASIYELFYKMESLVEDHDNAPENVGDEIIAGVVLRYTPGDRELAGSAPAFAEDGHFPVRRDDIGLRGNRRREEHIALAVDIEA